MNPKTSLLIWLLAWLTLLPPVLAQNQPAKIELTPAEHAWLAAHPDIRLGGGDGTFIPYVKREDNSDIVGIEPDLLARINALTGANLRLVLGTWADLVKQAERGELEGLVMTIADPKRAERFLFSTSSYHSSLYIYTRGGISSPLHSMEDLAGKKVGLLRGALLHQTHLARWPSIIPVPLDSAKAAGLALLNGEIDAAIAGIALRQIWHSELFPGLDIAFPVPNSDTPIIYSIRKEHPELLSIINKALATIGPAEIQQILTKWGATYDAPTSKVVLTDAEQAWIKTHPEIHLGIDKGWTPFVKLQDNGDIVGIEPDLLARIKALTGANIHLVLGKWTDMVAQAERGELDGLAMSAAHPERAERFLFSTSPYSISRFVYVPSNTATTLRSMADLAGKRVGFTAGHLAETKLLAKWPQIIPVPLSSGRELAVALMNHDIDAAISGITLLRTLREELLPDLTIAFVVPESESKLLYSIGKEYPELLSIINKALAVISPAEVQGILEKWGAVYNAPTTELVLTEEERAWLREHPKIVLGSTGQFQPYVIVKPDGSYDGLIMDYFNLLNQQLGNRLQLYVESDWQQVTGKAIKQEIDGLAISTPNPTWDQHFLYTAPYHFAYFYLYTRTDTTNSATTAADLAGKRVGYLAGAKGIEYQLRDVPGVKAFSFNSNEAVVNALLNEQVEVLIGTINLEWWRKQHSNFAFKIASILTDTSHPMVISIRNDWKMLPGILNKALNNIPTAEQERINQRWLSGPNALPINSVRVLTEAERTWIAAHPEVVVGYTLDLPPILMQAANGSYSGMLPDYLALLEKHLGLTFRLKVGTIQAVMKWLEAGEIDVIGPHYAMKEYLPRVNFTPPLFKSYPYIFLRNDDPRNFTKLDDLRGQRVGYLAGSKSASVLQKYSAIEAIPQPTLDAAVKALSNKQFDALIANGGLEFWRKENQRLNFKMSGQIPEMGGEVVMSVSKQQPELFAILEKAFLTLISPAELEEVTQRWSYSGQSATTVKLNAEERAWLQEKRVVHVRIGDFPPYHFWDNGPRGICVELLDNIAKNVGFQIEYRYGTSWTEAMNSLRNHAGIDLLPTAKHTSDREDFLAFGKDYLELPWVIFTRENDQRIFSLQDLFGKTIAVEEGYALQKQLTDQYPQIKQIKVREAAAALLAVSGGKVDAYIGNLPVAQYHIAHRGISNLKVVANTTIGAHTQAFAVRKDWAPLATILDKGLAAIPTETRSSINRKYFSIVVSETVNYTLLWQLAGVALLIIGMMLYWNRRLAKEIISRKQTEQQLQDTSERLRSVLTSMEDLVFVLDAEGRFTESYQDDPEKMMMSPAAFVGKHYRKVLPAPLCVQLDEAIAHAKGGDAQHFEYPLEVHTGWRWFHAALSPRYQSNGEFAGNTVVVRDITEHRQTMQQLQENQELLELVFNLNPDSVIITRLIDGIVIKVNEGFTTMSGFAREQVVGKQTLSVDLWENPEDRQHVIDELARKGICENYEAVFKRKEGSKLVGILSARRFTSQGIPHVITVTRNITERKQIELVLRQNEERYRSLITAMAEGIVMQNHDGEIVECNAAAERILGLTREQMMGRTSLDPRWRAVREDGSPFPGEEHPLPVVLRTGQPQRNVVHGVHQPNGELRWILVNAEPLFQPGETTPYAGVATLSDITDSSAAAQQIEEHRRTLQTVLDHLPAGVQVFAAPDARPLLSNRQAQELLGQEISQTDIEELNARYGAFIYGTDTLYPPEKMPLVRALKGEISMVEDMELYRLDGSRILLQVIGAPIFDEKQNITAAVVIFLDITLRKQTELELIKAREAAESANRAKSAFIANMSHELRTPLNAVLGFAQILLRDRSLGDLQQNQVQSIQRGGEYLLTLINDILDLAKIEAGRFELFPETWDTRSVFQELNYMFRIRTEQKNLEFRYEQVTPLPYSLYCDHKRLRQILINLLGNAVKFTERGNVTLRTGYEAGRLWLEVVDSGIGIAAADLGKIFEPFRQTGTDHYKMQGTGLGLAITYRLVQAMAGTLQVDSLLGQGSVFRVEVPAKAMSTATETHSSMMNQPAVIGYHRTGEGGPMRVLGVDDLADNRNVLRQLLEPLGFEMAEAENGQHCLDLVPDYQPEVIFMDLRMPDMDGLQVTRALRARGFHMPVIALSASTFAADRAASLEAGCNAHLAKPVHLAEVLETLAQLLSLEWKYADAPVQDTVAEEKVLETLSAEQAEQILRLNQIGDIVGLKEFAKKLEVAGPQLAKEISELVNAFEFDKIDELVEKSRGR